MISVKNISLYPYVENAGNSCITCEWMNVEQRNVVTINYFEFWVVQYRLYYIFCWNKLSCKLVVAETNIFRKIRETVFKMLSMRDLVIFNVPDERFISIPNQVRILHGSHVDFWMLGIKPDFVKVLWTDSDLHFASS